MGVLSSDKHSEICKIQPIPIIDLEYKQRYLDSHFTFHNLLPLTKKYLPGHRCHANSGHPDAKNVLYQSRLTHSNNLFPSLDLDPF